MHGDVSPKNILVTPIGGVILVDHEVAHYGDPGFDVAFCVSHLVLKSFHAPAHARALIAAARGFFESYRATTGDAPGFATHVADLIGPLLLARIDGKSPVEYLDEPTRAAVRTFAIGRLRAGATAIDRLLDDVAIAVHVRAPA